MVALVLSLLTGTIALRGLRRVDEDDRTEQQQRDKKLAHDVAEKVFERMEIRNSRTGTGFEVVENSGPPQPFGNTLTVPPGAQVSGAVGTGRMHFVVPSGIPFSMGSGPTEFDYDISGKSIALPDGGTVTPSGMTG